MWCLTLNHDRSWMIMWCVVFNLDHDLSGMIMWCVEFYLDHDLSWMIMWCDLLLVYYIIKMSTQTLLLYDPLHFPLIYLNHIRLYKTLSYRSHTLCFFYFTDVMLRFIYIYVHFYVSIYYYYNPALCALNILLLSIIPSSFYGNHTT